MQHKDYSLEPSTVHLWHIDLNVAREVLEQHRSVLSPEERERADRFRLPVLTERFVAAHGALRDILSRYLNAIPEQLVFEGTGNGKPCLAAPFAETHIQFNLSHSHDYALLGISIGAPIGVDIEKIDSHREHLSLARRYFASAEFNALKKLPKTQWAEAFCRCWVGKEAFIKAIGEGLRHPLHAFEVDFMGEGDRLLSKAQVGNLAAWRLKIFSVGANFCGALAVELRDIEAAQSVVQLQYVAE